MTGAIKDTVLQKEEIACILCTRLCQVAPVALKARFQLYEDDLDLAPYDLFLRIGKKRGLFMGGGQVDETRCASMLLDEFRGGKIGRITLEKPD